MSSFESVLETIMSLETRFSREAYVFVQMAMEYYRAKYGAEEQKHLTGQELLMGLRELALEQFGPLAPQVLNHWGLFRGEDVGDIVYLFLDYGIMKKNEEDQKEDFAGFMEFNEDMGKEYRW